MRGRVVPHGLPAAGGPTVIALTDAMLWWGGFVLLVAVVYLAGLWVASKRNTNALCVLIGHKFKYHFA
jgi:hypothetical protein